MVSPPRSPEPLAPAQRRPIKDVLDTVRSVLPASAVAAAPEAPGEGNVGMYRERIVHATLRPTEVSQVQELVKVFGGPGTPCGLHAISTGRNWGLGSREPATDNAVTLDLSGLSRIRTLDLDRGFAVVEPGVTQGALAKQLSGTGRIINVTASSAHTSVVGNGLDRGVGLRRQRVDDLAGLEVVLPDGDLAHVGWWPEEHRSTAVYSHGLGPELTPLFSQSNLGVVTAAVVRLLPRPEAQRTIHLSFTRNSLAGATDAMRRWVSQGLVGGVLKVYDVVSAELYGGRVGEFLAHISVDGTDASARAVARVIVEEAHGTGLFTEVHDSAVGTGSDDVVVRMVESAYAGDPDNNDALLEATLGQTAEHIDAEGLGWLFFLPMVPFSGQRIAEAHELLGRVFEETGVRAGCTVNALSSDIIDFVVSIKFQRNDLAAGQAHSALERCYELFAERGFIPYRLDIDHAEWVDRLSTDSRALQLTRDLKTFLDPNGAIAPGRYA